jgi:hypothetical protein
MTFDRQTPPSLSPTNALLNGHPQLEVRQIGSYTSPIGVEQVWASNKTFE